MELFIMIINGLLLLAVTVGVYKNKIDKNEGNGERLTDIDTRLIRLEEKVNYIYLTIKDKK
jgi:hypothetical protein